jgi:hypothetical protein
MQTKESFMLCRPLNCLGLPVVLILALLARIPQAQTHQPPRPAPAVQASIARAYGKLPLAFEANRGQTDPSVKFLAHTPQGTLFLTGTEAVLTLPQHQSQQGKKARGKVRSHDKPAPVKLAVLRMKLVGANLPRQFSGQNLLPGTVNYFRGRNPKKWHTQIPTYGKAAFVGVYPGVDMVYYGTQDGHLEYDFVIQPGADPKRIKLAFSGTRQVCITKEGDLALSTASGEVRWHRPLTYQVVDGRRREVACSYHLQHQGMATEAQFVVAAYDVHHSLIIDPTLQYSTYLGGSGTTNSGDIAYGIAVDGVGNAYVTGTTASSDFPVTTGAFQTTNKAYAVGGNNAFVTKLNATGSALIYSTYLGGSTYDDANSIAVDGENNAYVTGYTGSSDFPVTTGAYQTTNKAYAVGGNNAFVTKLNATGSALIYSTYLGGSALGGLYTVGDSGNGIAVDGENNAYVTGSTGSSDFPVTAGAFQTTKKNVYLTTFVTKLNTTGSALIYSTYLGGSTSEGAFGIAVDGEDNAYVTGATGSTDFPVTAGAFQTTNKNVINTTFVTKLNTTGSALIYSTYLGGSHSDYPDGIAVDGEDNAYVTGYTGSTDFPVTAGAFQTTKKNVNFTIFVTKLNATGSALIYSTYLGGSTYDSGNGIAVDGENNAYVTGSTGSTDFPVTTGAFQTTNKDAIGSNAFVTKLNAAGNALIYSTYLGGSGTSGNNGDQANCIAVDGQGNAYVTGYTYSINFPVTAGAFQTKNRAYADGGNNAFVSKFLFDPLVITDLVVTNLTPSSATIQWTTSLNASTLINYGITPGYGSTTSGAANVITHTVTLTGLLPNTLYDFQVNSNGSGYTTTQTGAFLTSTTAPQIVVSGYNFTRSGNDLFVDLTLTNTGTATAQNIQITNATLGSKISSGLPVTSPAIAASGTQTLIHALHFNAADFPSGTRTVLSGSGIYTGGRFSAAARVSVP